LLAPNFRQKNATFRLFEDVHDADEPMSVPACPRSMGSRSADRAKQVARIVVIKGAAVGKPYGVYREQSTDTIDGLSADGQLTLSLTGMV
jgi:hypothetical protein